jgi:signal transduction histidine kinase
MEEKAFSYENFNRHLPFLTQVVEKKHQNELINIINGYEQRYEFNSLDEFLITNAYGANLVTISGKADYIQLDQDWWQKTKSNGLYVGDIEYVEKYSDYFIPIGISISDENQKFIGSAYILIKLKDLILEFANTSDLLKEQNKSAFLLDKNGRIIYSDGLVFDQDLEISYKKELNQLSGNFVGADDYADSVIAFAKSENSDTNGVNWIVVIEQKKSDIIADIRDSRDSIILPSVIGISITIIIGIIITFFVSRPLRELAHLSSEIARGNFDVQADKTKIHEIGTISDSFNDMIQSLKKLVQTEKELAEARIKVRNERLTALGEFSASMAHDMKNPLAILKTSLDVIKIKFKGHDEKIDKLLSNMDIGISRMSHQIKDVLDYVRITPVNITDVNLNKIIKYAIESLEIPKQVSIELPVNDITIKCDVKKMEIVLINLILNAIQAIGKNTGKITINSKEMNNHYEIEIQNTGEPISDSLLEKIFEPLFTTKYQGTGLGLSTCKNIIEQHGGTISAYNNPTTFRIKFPKKIKDN